MSAPFASKLFETSSNNTDGWDEWDWVDNNNATNVTKGQQQQQPQHQQHYQQQQQQQQLQHTQYIQQQPQLGFPTPQNMPTQVADNTAHYFNSINHAPAPTIDFSSQQVHTNEQYAAPIPNNNHITSASGFHHDNNTFQPHQTFVNDQSANNNFVQSTAPTYQHHQNSNSLGFVQVESHETIATPSPPVVSTPSMPVVSNVPSVPPVPARTPFNEYAKIDQNVAEKSIPDSAFTAYAYPNSQVQSHQVVASEPPSAPVPVFTNSLPPVIQPPSLNQSPFANTNPFKRVGSHAHRTPPPPPVAAVQPVSTQPTPTSDTFSNAVPRATHLPDATESIPHNDRNEYLQTGHLSEDGENNTIAPIAESQTQYSSSDGNGDSLPPPGLSRLVLGEQEASESSNSQPPPGLDRLVTGIEISQSGINLERQADGQDNSTPAVPQITRSNSQFSNVQPQQPVSNLPPAHSTDMQTFEIEEPISESDRNQYLVAGENAVDDTANTAPVPPTATIERVVTGLENVEKPDKVLPNRQREVDMDGENVEDKPQKQQQHQPQQQNQRFANTPKTLSQSDSIEDLDAPSNYSQKNQMIPSSDEDSDREKYYSRGKGQPNKRGGDDRRKRRDDSRYETEDTDHSIRERRRLKESDRYEKERGYRGRSADIDENDSRAYRDRGEKAYRGEKHYRPPSRDDDDRYYRLAHFWQF